MKIIGGIGMVEMLNFTDKVVGVAVVEHSLTEKDIESIMVGGIEGGINYWAGLNNVGEYWEVKPKTEPSSMWAVKLLLEGKVVEFYDREDENEIWKLSLKDLIKGYSQNAKERPHDSSLEDGDATTCDCIIQYALFGKLVFG